MESYKEIHKMNLDKIDLYNTELLEVIDKKDLVYKQYNDILNELISYANKVSEIQEKQEEQKFKKTNILRIVEMLSLVLAFVLILGVGGNYILPILVKFCGDILGNAILIAGSLLCTVVSIISIFKIDKFLSNKIVKKLEKTDDYKKLLLEEENFKTLMSLRELASKRKFEEYAKLTAEEENIREEIKSYEGLLELLESLINEDEEIKNTVVEDNKLVKKRVKENK